MHGASPSICQPCRKRVGLIKMEDRESNQQGQKKFVITYGYQTESESEAFCQVSEWVSGYLCDMRECDELEPQKSNN